MATEGASKAELEVVVRTDVGVVRDHNEDALFADPEERFFIVADGMGGHAAGEVASAMAVSTVREELEQHADLIASMKTIADRQRVIEALEAAVRRAHQLVFERGAAESDKQGMGTTLDVLLIAGGDAFVAHVGDSRTYLLRDGAAAQITTDHTVAEVLLIEGKLSPEEAAASHLRTVLVNAIGVAPQVGVEMAHFRLKAGDHILLCSDGLHDYFPVEQELADRALDPDDIESALEGMVELAKERGGHDNITGILLKVISAPAGITGLSPEETATTLQGEAVPEAIARDDTMPIDADAAIAEVEKAQKLVIGRKMRAADEVTLQEADVARAKTEEREAAKPVEDDASTAQKKGEALARELKTTVPMKPLKPPPDRED